PWRRRLDQVADGGQRVEKEVRIDLRTKSAQLRLTRQLADLLFANFSSVSLVRDSDRIDSTSDHHGNCLECRHIVGQEAPPRAQWANGEHELRLIGGRYGDTGGHRTSQCLPRLS